jgi:hypothetical protein
VERVRVLIALLQVTGLEEDLAFVRSEMSRLVQQHALAEERAAVATAAAHYQRRNKRDEETLNRAAYRTRTGDEDDYSRTGGEDTFQDEHEKADEAINRQDADVEAAREAALKLVTSGSTEAGCADEAGPQSAGHARALGQKEAELAAVKQALARAVAGARARDGEWGAVVDGLEDLVVSLGRGQGHSARTPWLQLTVAGLPFSFRWVRVRLGA